MDDEILKKSCLTAHKILDTIDNKEEINPVDFLFGSTMLCKIIIEEAPEEFEKKQLLNNCINILNRTKV